MVTNREKQESRRTTPKRLAPANQLTLAWREEWVNGYSARGGERAR